MFTSIAYCLSVLSMHDPFYLSCFVVLFAGFSSGSVEFSPADSIENASQNNDGRRPSDAVTSIEYLHSSTNDDDDDEDDIQYNNQTDFYPSRVNDNN